MSDINYDLLKQAFDKALDLILILEADYNDVGNSKIIYANDAVASTLGYSIDEMLGNSPRMFQGESTDKMTRMEIRVSLKQQKPIHSKILNYTKNGEPIWLDINMVPLHNNKGEVTHFCATERVTTAPE
ncbi:MAG: PAS domain-containing protein [Gammaproteobacteria bacterium]|nr:PAS domain-containing protein [Gammaproteobacteria bacterium]